MSIERYWAAETEAEPERTRLELLEQRYDDLTFRRLQALRPSAGWSCLEVGAGAGSVTRWLAEQVGTAGRVVATDLDPRFLEGIARPNVEVRRHDILSDPLEQGSFDLAHCRALLCHLSDPLGALERMVSALRPGGWLLVEDADFTSLAAACASHPLAATWDRASKAMSRFFASTGLLDPYLGRRLPGLVASLGLDGVGHERLIRIHQGGSPAAEFLRRTIEAIGPRLRDAGVVTDDELAALTHTLADPSFAVADACSVAAWGRRSSG